MILTEYNEEEHMAALKEYYKEYYEEQIAKTEEIANNAKAEAKEAKAEAKEAKAALEAYIKLYGPLPI